MAETEPVLVVGYGRAEAGDHALAIAAGIAPGLGARLRVVHVVTADDYPDDPDSETYEDEGRRRLRAGHQHVEDVLAATPEGRGGRLRWTQEVRHGDPVTVLIRAAEDRDTLMIVVGTRGEGATATLSRLLEPSVSHGLIRHQHRPVLVVPPPDEHR
ncbi:universal stress protein [Pseudonocardia nematodicida]|uniref:Universal stress protein n=1 Tax=Pseudonocardia nematodicida TaxID=1206997 RepID=A0ABV1KJG5_9PSEU